MKHFKPLSSKNRIYSIDTLRGVALLGILLINIVGMGLPDPSYFDPSLMGGHEGWNLKVFIINSIFFEGTMRGLFSLLFGAGIVLFLNKDEEEIHRLDILEVWFRRLIWLVILGMIHAYVLLWPGDILFSYGLIGLLLFPFRRLSPIKLIGMALSIMAIGVFLNFQDANTAKTQQAQYFEGSEMIRKGEPLPYDTMVGYYKWMETYAIMKPAKSILQSRIEKYQKGYFQAFNENKVTAQFFESEYHYRHNYIDILSMMLLGIALFKLKILHAQKSYGFYISMMLIGYGIGIPINYFETMVYIHSDFSLITYYELLLSYDVGRIATMFGHIGLVMLFCKSEVLYVLKSSLSAVGRMALSNYLMHSFFASVIFVGFKQYGEWERSELY